MPNQDLADEFTVAPPVAPMLANAVATLPLDPGLAYEPKWDGFRAICYRRGDRVLIQGRLRTDDGTGRWDLSYAFPEVIELLRQVPAADFVIDGELVIRRGEALDFDALGMRLRPRHEAGGWKIAQLATELPAEFVAFDVLGAAGEDLREQPFEGRREALQTVLAGAPAQIHLTPQTRDPQVAARWFAELPGAGLDGVVVKPLAGRYEPGKRTMFKVKHRHTTDVVAAGWREYSRPGPHGPVVGSILLGAYDEAGVLQFLGAAAAFSGAKRAELAELFASLTLPANAPHPWFDPMGRAPGGPSRWGGGRRAEWHPLQPSLVCEVAYDQVQGDRFRHVAQFVRWRPDRDPASCRTDQLFRPEPWDVGRLLPPPPTA